MSWIDFDYGGVNMFCSKCGTQLSDEALFCSNCGSAQSMASEANITNVKSENKELDREAIKIYLSNVLALECFIQKLSKKYELINNAITKFESRNYNERFHCSKNNYAWLRYDGNKFYLWFSADNNGKYFLGMHKDIYYEAFGVEHQYAGAWLPIDENIEYLNNPANYPATYSSLNLLGELVVEPIISSSQRKSNQKGFWEAYDRFKIIGPQKYQENLKEIMPFMNDRDGIEKEIKEAKMLLQKAYDINIIPKQFRNIHAIWFIHDYVTSSTESLSAAFLHCNLDEIKQKLDTIIEQQKEIIINQRILMSQNRQMIEQNQQTLDKLARIEQNTDRAAQYAEIASNNAEACAWIGVANYIKTK